MAAETVTALRSGGVVERCSTSVELRDPIGLAAIQPSSLGEDMALARAQTVTATVGGEFAWIDNGRPFGDKGWVAFDASADSGRVIGPVAIGMSGPSPHSVQPAAAVLGSGGAGLFVAWGNGKLSEVTRFSLPFTGAVVFPTSTVEIPNWYEVQEMIPNEAQNSVDALVRVVGLPGKARTGYALVQISMSRGVLGDPVWLSTNGSFPPVDLVGANGLGHVFAVIGPTGKQAQGQQLKARVIEADLSTRDVLRSGELVMPNIWMSNASAEDLTKNGEDLYVFGGRVAGAMLSEEEFAVDFAGKMFLIDSTTLGVLRSFYLPGVGGKEWQRGLQSWVFPSTSGAGFITVEATPSEMVRVNGQGSVAARAEECSRFDSVVGPQ
jgi:hypothetical protein